MKEINLFYSTTPVSKPNISKAVPVPQPTGELAQLAEMSASDVRTSLKYYHW